MLDLDCMLEVFKLVKKKTAILHIFSLVLYEWHIVQIDRIILKGSKHVRPYCWYVVLCVILLKPIKWKVCDLTNIWTFPVKF